VVKETKRRGRRPVARAAWGLDGVDGGGWTRLGGLGCRGEGADPRLHCGKEEGLEEGNEGRTGGKAPVWQRRGGELGGRDDQPEEGEEEDGGDFEAADEDGAAGAGVVDEEAGRVDWGVGQFMACENV